MRYSNVWGSLVLGSTLAITGCGGESPHIGSSVNVGDVTGNLPDVNLPISVPDPSAAVAQITGLLNTIAGMLADLEAIEGTNLNGAVSELVNALNGAQQTLGEALNQALAGDNTAANSEVSDTLLNLFSGDLKDAVNQLSAAFLAQFPAANDPFASIVGNLDIAAAAFGGSGEISPALLDNAVGVLQPLLTSVGLGVETIELLSMAEALQTGLDDIAGRPDLVPGVVPHPLSSLSPTLTALQTAVQSGDLQTALGEAQTLVPLAGLPSLLTELGLLSNPLSGLLPDITNASSSDLNDPANRADVIELLADVVGTVNEILLGLIPHSVDPTFDPLVGAIIAITNLLDNVGGNPEGTSVAEALVGNLDGEQTSTALANSLRDLFNDLFTGVFPVTEITNDVALALGDTTTAAADITEEGLAGLLTPLTDVLAPMIACLDNVEPVGSAVDSLLGLGDGSCFVTAP
ncbi:MAG: hypothetical protein OXT49_00940 [Gammaproteobacteria bacterium]|nr:hypothetical protein [Gammaproteobacteria bacterium]